MRQGGRREDEVTGGECVDVNHSQESTRRLVVSSIVDTGRGAGLALWDGEKQIKEGYDTLPLSVFASVPAIPHRRPSPRPTHTS